MLTKKYPESPLMQAQSSPIYLNVGDATLARHPSHDSSHFLQNPKINQSINQSIKQFLHSTPPLNHHTQSLTSLSASPQLHRRKRREGHALCSHFTVTDLSGSIRFKC
ncbi:hypothetical protein NC651_035826 [Populus alba x Populus x berolinensis]|nr:hypothetical protein NC651_035826 [Populus alba x Populus x berolinensis]